MPPSPPFESRSAQRDAVIALFGLALLLAWDASGLDLPLMRLFGSAQGFAWREHWLTARVLHEGGRYLSIALFTLTFVNVLHPVGPWRGLTRGERIWWLGVTVLCLVLIPLIKRHSATSCPWELQEFGGTAHYLSHWRAGWTPGFGDGGPGHCFPSGHASGAYSFLAIGFVLRRLQPRLANRWLVALALLGLVFGLAQMARGAHYLSHTLYTAWVCWSLTAASWHALRARRVSLPLATPAA